MATEGWARSLSLDILAQYRGLEENGQFRFTPPTHVLLAFHQALLELAQDHGVQDSRGVVLPLRLSQRDLANLIGVKRESVNLAGGDCRKRGLVELDGRTLRILRPDALGAIR